jgi:hypothetical protein
LLVERQNNGRGNAYGHYKDKKDQGRVVQAWQQVGPGSKLIPGMTGLYEIPTTQVSNPKVSTTTTTITTTTMITEPLQPLPPAPQPHRRLHHLLAQPLSKVTTTVTMTTVTMTTMITELLQPLQPYSHSSSQAQQLQLQVQVAQAYPLQVNSSYHSIDADALN